MNAQNNPDAAPAYPSNLPQAGPTWRPRRLVEYTVEPGTYFALVMLDLTRHPQPDAKPPFKMSQTLSRGYMRYQFSQQQLERLVMRAAQAGLLF